MNDPVVLLVQPEQTLYHAALADAGFEVLPAEDGERAMEICADPQQRIDLVICRVILGALTGPELAQKVKGQRNVPILLVSKYPRDVIRSVRGFSFDLEVLEEPTNEELVQRARKALRRGKRS